VWRGLFFKSLKMKKEDRLKVFEKCGGRCAYCGCELKSNWHVDHVEPVNRTRKLKPGYYRHKETKLRVEQKNLPDKWWMEHEHISQKLVFDKMTNPERDTIENSRPSCHSCNITKSSMSVEGFREYIQGTVESLNKNNYAAYKFAKRYGLVQETVKPVKFYFETLNPQ
jgi:hypothetical protein